MRLLHLPVLRLIQSVRGQGRIIERNLRCWLLLKAIQPVKEFNQHFQCVLLAGLHCFVKICPHFPRIWIVFELDIFSMKCDGVVEAELRCVFEQIRDSLLAEVPMKRTRYVGEYEGNILGQ